VPKAQAYNTIMYIMAELLVVGFLANLCVKAFDKRHHLLSHAAASMKPKHRVGQIAAAVAESGNPQGR